MQIYLSAHPMTGFHPYGKVISGVYTDLLRDYNPRPAISSVHAALL
jgi:hypothetical protein